MQQSLAYYGWLSKTSQAVLQVGENVPPNVRSASRHEVTNTETLQKVILKAKNLAGLNASTNATLPSVLSAWNTVFQYVGAQCGSVGSSSQGVLAHSNPN